MSFDQHMTLDARLVILKALAGQKDYRLNTAILLAELDRFGHRRPREWVHTQLRFLADLGAVVIDEAGTIMVATLTRLGLDHVERRQIIEGVARPGPEG